MDLRRTLYQNMVLSGGSTLIKGRVNAKVLALWSVDPGHFRLNV